MKTIIILTFILSISANSLGQHRYVEKITESQGLSDNRVTCFRKDHIGYMWIGTENGLNRFDGHSFRIYRPGQKKYSLSHERISDMEEDTHGRLWIATWHGLNVLNPATDSLHVFLPGDTVGQIKNSIANDLIWDIHIDKQEKVWLALDVRDLCYYDLRLKTFNYFPWRDFVDSALPDYRSYYKSIHKIIRKSENELWLGTTVGLFSFNVETKNFKWYGGDAPEDVTYMHYDSTLQKIYFSQKKLYVYDIQKGRLSTLSTTHANQFIYPKASTILVPSFKELWIIDKTKDVASSFPIDEKGDFAINHEKTNSVYKDNGLTWIGSSSGIRVYNQYSDIFPFIQVFSDTLKKTENIYHVFNADRDKYLATLLAWNSLLTLDAPSGVRKEITRINNVPISEPSKIMEDSKHRLWVLSARRIFVSDTHQEKFSVFQFPAKIENYRFIDMVEDANGDFWFASLRYGIFHFRENENEWKLIPYDLNGLFVDRPTALLSDSINHCVWIGDYGFGLFRYDLISKKFYNFKANPNDPSALQSSLVNAIALDMQRDIWVSTTSGGVSKYVRDKNQFITFSMETGLPENTIYSICCDLRGNLWLASSKGITHIKPSGEIIKHYGIRELPAGNFNTPFSRNDQGYIMIGADNGFIKFHPDSIKITSPVFGVVLTEAFQNNQVI